MTEKIVDEKQTSECLFCKSEIAADALRCPHCLASLSLVLPDHRGMCPLCRSEIHRNALRCKYCKGRKNKKASQDTTRENHAKAQSRKEPESFAPLRLCVRQTGMFYFPRVPKACFNRALHFSADRPHPPTPAPAPGRGGVAAAAGVRASCEP